jgi:hypothetical protein
VTQTIDHVELLRASEKFRTWRRLALGGAKPQLPDLRTHQMAERHYTPAELAETWGVSAETIRVLFREEPGVLKIGPSGTRFKRGYKTLRIPHSVAERVHTRLSA